MVVLGWLMQVRRGLLLLTVIFLTGCQTNTFTHKQFRDRIGEIHTLGLVPTQIHTALLNFTVRPDPVHVSLPDEQRIRSELTASTIAQLRQRGFVVKVNTLESGASGDTNEVCDARMNTILTNAYWSLQTKTVRPEASTLANNMNVDGLVFLNASAYKSTPRRQAVTATWNFISFLGALAGGGGDFYAQQQALVQVTLVDVALFSRTGTGTLPISTRPAGV